MPAPKAEAGDGEFRASLDYIGTPCLNKNNTIQTAGIQPLLPPCMLPHTTRMLNPRCGEERVPGVD